MLNGMFASDEKTAELLRSATAFKSKKDWNSALASLAEAKKRMLVSPVAYPAQDWCKYPLYLQQSGRFEESMAEFQFLLDDLDRRARRDASLDDPNVGTKARKISYYKLMIRNDRKIIKEKMELARKRQQKADAKKELA